MPFVWSGLCIDLAAENFLLVAHPVVVPLVQCVNSGSNTISQSGPFKERQLQLLDVPTEGRVRVCSGKVYLPINKPHATLPVASLAKASHLHFIGTWSLCCASVCARSQGGSTKLAMPTCSAISMEEILSNFSSFGISQMQAVDVRGDSVLGSRMVNESFPFESVTPPHVPPRRRSGMSPWQASVPQPQPMPRNFSHGQIMCMA